MEVMVGKFFAGKKVLITGHTGFKGAWLSFWLKNIGAKVFGIALPPETEPSLFKELRLIELMDGHYEIDLSKEYSISEIYEVFKKREPEILFHLAARSLVLKSYSEPVHTWATNLMGTVYILEVMRYIPCVKVAVMITTDKVYSDRCWIYPYREIDEIGGFIDPYSSSKAACEIAIKSYREAFLKDIAVASVRAGNVIGGGDWAEDRIIPDAVRAWSKGESLLVRNPNHVRPWQHVLDALYGYMELTHKLWEKPELSGAYNFGPYPHDVVKVEELIKKASDLWGKEATYVFSESKAEQRESPSVFLDISKAMKLIGYKPRWRFDKALENTILWYKKFFSGINARVLCEKDIEEWERGE